MKRIIKIAVLALLLLPVVSMANMRAAMRYWQAPSSSLLAVDSGTLGVVKVVHEKLKIACDHNECQVEATYQLRASQALELPLEFILPTDAVVMANINGKPSGTLLSADSPEQRSDVSMQTRLRGYGKELWQIYKASFTASLQEGINQISVYYTQPLSILEADYGYFTRSKFVEAFTYILAPLKTWQLAEDFSIDLEVLTLAKKPERNPWRLFNRRSIDCFLPNAQVTRQSGWVIYRTKMGREFADNLECTLGDTDLLRQYER